MRPIIFSVMAFLFLFSVLIVPAQTVPTSEADSLLNANGEVYFKFTLSNRAMLDSITRIISIVTVYNNGEVLANANRDEFTRFLALRFDYTVLPPMGSLLSEAELNMGNAQKDNLDLTTWNFYPTYPQYLTYMSGFASSYPSICKIDTIGKTIRGRYILAVKISDSVNYDRGVPQVFLTSSMHGDETTGYIEMLHLIEYLLTGYGTDPRITDMIENTQIFINPLANPDGTYRGGDDNVSGAVRRNTNNVDLNRNYADPRTSQHPDGLMWQPETEAFMKYADYKHFNLSMNFHGGAEVFNYPWDTWYPPPYTADDSWWQWVGNEYADTAQFFGPAGYFTNPYASGITNGAVWYVITGGRQDYHNYFKHTREVTLEISNAWIQPAGELINHWNYNYRSFLNYIEQSGYGINGKVYDSVTFAPIGAKVFVQSHDVDSSWVYSSLPSGWYFRMIDAGTWSLTFSAPGYYSRTITGITATRYAVNRLNVKLRPIDQYWPRSLVAIPVSAHQIDLSWSLNGVNDPVMVAYSTSGTFGTPANGTTYAPGGTIPGGGYVIYNGSGTAFSHDYLEPGTLYYYRAWSVRSGITYTAPATTSATTYCGTHLAFPITEPFTAATVQLPICWSEDITGANIIQSWRRNNSASAGGTAWEMRSARQTSTTATSGTIRLKTFFFNTTGISLLNLSFRHFIDARATGVTFKIQSSTDGVTWTDESWTVTPGTTNVGPALVSLNITNNINSPTTIIAFVITGNPRNYDFWYIDDVSITAPGYWVGGTFAAPTDWNTASNWGDNLVPTATTNCYIPGRPYLPIVSNDPASPAVCNNLVVNKWGAVTVSPGKKLVVNGTFTLQAP
jgi:hypothetical protein